MTRTWEGPNLFLSLFIAPFAKTTLQQKKEILLLATPPSDCKTNTRVLLPDTHALVERRGGSKTNICESFRTSSSSSFSKGGSCYLCTYATPSLFFCKASYIAERWRRHGNGVPSRNSRKRRHNITCFPNTQILLAFFPALH